MAIAALILVCGFIGLRVAPMTTLCIGGLVLLLTVFALGPPV